MVLLRVFIIIITLFLYHSGLILNLEIQIIITINLLLYLIMAINLIYYIMVKLIQLKLLVKLKKII